MDFRARAGRWGRRLGSIPWFFLGRSGRSEGATARKAAPGVSSPWQVALGSQPPYFISASLMGLMGSGVHDLSYGL